MLNISDKNFLLEIVADAVVQAHLTCPDEKLRDGWVNAIAQATLVLECEASFLHWNALEKALYFRSPDTHEIYKATDRCCERCDASQIPCRHCALSRLVENYFGLQQKPGAAVAAADRVDFADAVFFDRELSARQKIELLNLSVAEGRVELKPLVQILEKQLDS